MEEIIREIVDADKQARLRVNEKQQERLDIQKLIQEKKADITLKYQEETKGILAKKKAELDAELDQETKQEDIACKEALSKLQTNYDAKKQEWVDTIIARCLTS